MMETAAALANEHFVRNMRPLWRLDARNACIIDAVRDDQRYPIERSRSGEWTVKGAGAYLHSRHDPLAEAEQWAAAVDVESAFCFVVAGFGLGHHLAALHRRLQGDAILVCTEPDVRMISTALSCVDLSELLASRRFVLLIDDDKNAIHTKLQSFSTLMMLGMQFVRHAASRAAGTGHEPINRALTEFVTFTRMSLTTLMANSLITCRNIAMNLNHYVSTPPIDALRDRFAGSPGVVVSAGPSLSRNIDQLGGLKGRAVICAVQTAVRPLMTRGIAADFVTTLDYHEMSRKFFESVGDLSHTHLIAEPKAAWRVLDEYPGPMSLLDNSWARLVLGEELGARAGLPAGATVAHLAFYLAVFLGCDPIIFVGQDLAYTGHVFYTPGVEIHRAWRSEINRFQSLEHKEWERIVRNRPILRRVPGQGGETLYTDELLFTYLEQFEKDVAGCGRTVINATEGGAVIRGMRTMRLQDAAEQFCSTVIDPLRFGPRPGHSEQGQESREAGSSSRLRLAAREVQQRIDELEEVVQVTDELQRLLDELDNLVDRPDRFNQRLIRVDELRAKISRESRAYRIVNAASQIAEFRRFSADRRIELSPGSTTDRARKQIARDREFMSGVREGALQVSEILKSSLDRIVAAQAKQQGALELLSP